VIEAERKKKAEGQYNRADAGASRKAAKLDEHVKKVGHTIFAVL
jgi:hypothetical protein